MKLEPKEQDWLTENEYLLEQLATEGSSGLRKIYSKLIQDLEPASADYLIMGFALLMECYNPFFLFVNEKISPIKARLVFQRRDPRFTGLISLTSWIDLDVKSRSSDTSLFKSACLLDFIKKVSRGLSPLKKLAGEMATKLDPEKAVVFIN